MSKKFKFKTTDELIAEENAEIKARNDAYRDWKGEVSQFASEQELRWLYDNLVEPRDADRIIMAREFMKEFPR